MQNIIFFGSDRYANTTLESLHESKKFTSIKVITDRPKPVGKDKVFTSSEVEKAAITHNLKYSYYPSNNDEMSNFIDILKNWQETAPNIGLCASFDHLIPNNIIKLFKGHLYNLHPSLLPQYRNVSPVQYSIALGDQTTGITLFRISEGIDSGEIIGQTEEPILDGDTTLTLTPRLFKLGARIFIDAIQKDFTGHEIHGITKNLIFTRRLTRDSGYIKWEILKQLLLNHTLDTMNTGNDLLDLRLSRESDHQKSSYAILHDLLRAFTPWPTVWSIVPSAKGDLRITLESVYPEIKLKIAGKPKSISWNDFSTYYI